MEPINHFIDQLKTRMNSVFWGSFFFSWFICNWKLTLALFWYSQQELCNHGECDLIRFIYKHWTNGAGIVLPVIVAFAYSIGYPWLDNFIQIQRTRARVSKEKEEEEIAKGGNIPAEVFFKKVKKIEELKQDLHSAIQEESLAVNELSENRRLINTLRGEKEALMNEIGDTKRQIMNSFNPNFLDGEWFHHYTGPDGKQHTERIRIQNSEIIYFNDSHIAYNPSSGKGEKQVFRENVGIIVGMHYRGNVLRFTKAMADGRYLYNELRSYQGDWIGKENGTIDIRYEAIPSDMNVD